MGIIKKSVTVNEGETIIVPCVGKTGPFFSMSWLKDGRNLTDDVTVSYESKSGFVTESVLEIKNATLDAAGKYTCVGYGGSLPSYSIVTVLSKFTYL